VPSLNDLGWGKAHAADFAALADPELLPARVAVRHKAQLVLLGEGGEMSAEIAGRLLHRARGAPATLPTVGDWVAARPGGADHAVVAEVLPRRGKLSRVVAGGVSEEQVLATHVDLALVVVALGAEVRVRRIERTLALARQAGVEPVVVLTKADLAADVEAAIDEASRVSGGAEVLAVSAGAQDGPGVARAGIEVLRGLLGTPGPSGAARTAVLLGPSGAGKSTLHNALLDEERLRVQAVRERDGKGRHTTTHRELSLLPSGGCLIDTPGMRELGLWDASGDELPGAGSAIGETFADVEALAASCRFGDCAHAGEPGCSIAAALAAGELDPGRAESWDKLRRELRWIEERHSGRARIEQRRNARVITRSVRERMRMKGNG
jgi:ribosome biogenesis GTPase